MQRKWIKLWSKRHSIRLSENWLYSTNQFESIFGARFPDQKVIIQNEVGYGYADAKQLETTLNVIFENIKKTGFGNVWEKKGVRIMDEFSQYCLKVGNLKLDKMPNNIILEYLIEYNKLEDTWMNYLWCIFILDLDLSDLTQKILENKYPGLGKKLLKKVIAPWSPTIAYTYGQDLRKYAKKYASGKKIGIMALEMCQKYSFMPILNMDEEPLVEEYFRNEIETASGKLFRGYTANEEMNLASNEKEYAKLVKMFEKGERNILESCHKVAYYREYRNDLRQKSYFHSRKLFFEISKRIGLTIGECIYLTRSEMRESLAKGKLVTPKTKITERMKLVGLTNIGNRIEYINSESEISNVFGKIHLASFASDEKSIEFRGISANPGKARGRIKVIMNIVKDSIGFKEGEILVTPTTNLQFVPIMNKAAAILIEEGGILTHGAIVSRELGIPCIVSLKNITKKLENGDLVEVDATKGTVRKLK